MAYLLLDDRGSRLLASADDPVVRVGRGGVIRRETLLGNVGRTVRIGHKSFVVLEASTADLLDALPRGAQAIGPKDAAHILLAGDIRSGKTVVEAGLGSGHLTVALARAVAPGGRVISYETRSDHIAFARQNLQTAAVENIVTVRQSDVTKGIVEQEVDAVVLDLPEPWAAVDVSDAALRPSGHFVSFSPNMEQAKATVQALRRRAFVDLRTVEVIEREMEVHDLGFRPSFAPLGHTGYLTFARKVLDTF